MELVSSWELAAPYLVVEGITFARGDAGRAALSPRAARIPWAIGSRENVLVLSVGPIAFEAGALEPALELYHYWHQSLAFHLPAESTGAARSGFRLAVPGGSFERDGLRAVAELAAPLVAPLLGSLALPPLRLDLDGSLLVATFGQAILPGMYDAVVPVLGAVLLPLVRDAVWASVPRDLERHAELVSIENGCIEIREQRHGALIGDAERLWQAAEEMLERFVPRGHLDAARRALHLHRVSSVPGKGVALRESAPDPFATGAGLLAIVPFRPGARPLDEVVEKGSGASEAIGYLSSGVGSLDEEDSGIWILFRLGALEPSEDVEVKMWACFLPPEGETGEPVPVPGLQGVDVAPQVVAATPDFKPTLVAAEYRAPSDQVHVASIVPQTQLLPARGPGENGYRWEDLDPSLCARCPDGEDPFTFAAFFQQRFAVTLAVYSAGKLVDQSSTTVEVFDTQRFGSLYERLLSLVAEDAARQAMALGASDVYAAHHPWYPVLAIGMNKAAFYVKAIHQDLAQQSKHLANPGWLLRVGLYLEYLTCIGVFEAVRQTYPDLLSREERTYYEQAPLFREIRERVAVDRWKEVWKLHGIVGKGNNPISAGPVAFTNLLRKQESTLAFLHAHHTDLQHAIELAGPNLESSQESWHRVYRDAERAVVNSSLAAFPELQHVPPRYRDFALWHVQGKFSEIAGIAGAVLPRWLTEAFGDQDGVYPSGARQYRASMNQVAAWARDKGLMDFAGKECIPRSVSLIEALLDEDDERFAALQARDGYAGSLEAVSHTLSMQPGVSRAMVSGFLRGLEIFSALDDAEIEQLAAGAKRISTVPTQEVVVEGRSGSSLFIVESGNLEVYKHAPGGERRIGRLRAGSVFGETALLTGEPRSATVRSLDYALLLEISKDALEPILARRPRIIDALSDLLATRSQHARGSASASRAWLATKMSEFVFGADPTLPLRRVRHPEGLVKLLETVKIFRPLNATELARLADRATVTTHVSDAPIVARGEKGSSVFIVETGLVEVVVPRDGRDITLARLGRGGVFGEMALLTGERRSATVRPTDGSATVVEISKSDLLPFISQRPALIIEFSELLAARQAENRSATSATSDDGPTLARRITSFFLA